MNTTTTMYFVERALQLLSHLDQFFHNRECPYDLLITFPAAWEDAFAASLAAIVAGAARRAGLSIEGEVHVVQDVAVVATWPLDQKALRIARVRLQLFCGGRGSSKKHRKILLPCAKRVQGFTVRLSSQIWRLFSRAMVIGMRYV